MFLTDLNSDQIWKRRKREEKIKEEMGEDINDDLLIGSGDDEDEGCEWSRTVKLWYHENI